MTSASAQPNEERLINVAIPKPLHRRAKAAAALSGQTLQDFVQRSIESAIPSQLGSSQQDGKKGNKLPVSETA